MKIQLTNLLCVFTLGLVVVSCGEPSAPTEATTETAASPDTISQAITETPTPPPADKNPDGIAGLYVGYFDAVEFNENKKPSYVNKITVSIDSVVANTLYGHSVVAGNKRPFSGTWKKEGKVYTATVKEPGDDQYDGAFDFKLFADKDSIQGTWTANQKKLAVTKREYALSKKEFKYDPSLDLPGHLPGNELYTEKELPADIDGDFEAMTDDVLKVNASKSLLKKADVENMYKGDLEVIRNAIYARHGYSFKNRKMRYLFDSLVDWYIPVNTDVRSLLTDVERKNIDLLKRYEEHASKYYDVYGR